MFQVTLVEHLRMTFGQVVHSYQAHARTAERLTDWAWKVRLTELVLIALATGSAFAGLFVGGRYYGFATALLLTLGLAMLIFELAAGFETRIYAHRSCGVRLWLVREKYRALLSDLSDGAIGLDAARERRDALMEELHSVYENAPVAERQEFLNARQALAIKEEQPVSSQEIDRLLQTTRKTA